MPQSKYVNEYDILLKIKDFIHNPSIINTFQHVKLIIHKECIILFSKHESL